MGFVGLIAGTVALAAAAPSAAGAVAHDHVGTVTAKIDPAPTFSPARLTALPRDGWITNGGNLFNQRYSPLELLNRDNVAA